MAITGRAVLLALVGLVPVLARPAPLTFLICLGVWILAVVADLALAASPRQVGVSRTVPDRLRLTETGTCTLLVRNLSRRRLRAVVRDAWQPSAGTSGERHTVSLAPGDGTRLRTGLTPTRRGVRSADRVTIRSLGPLGVAGRQVSLTVPASVRVLPEFRSRRHLPSRLARLRELDGAIVVNVRGQGTEFDSLREYTVGDDVRSIDWRATARGERVVVRTWRPERDRRVLMVVDTSRLSAARLGDEPRLESAIEATLLLGALAARAGDRVEMLAWDRRARAHVGPLNGTRVLAELSTATACLEPALLEADWTGLVQRIRSMLSQRALVVLLTPLEPAVLESGLLPVLGSLTRAHRVVVAGPADPQVTAMAAGRGDLEEVLDAAAADRVDLERGAAIAALQRLGATVVHAAPEDLAPRLADAYLALKKAGKL